MSTKISKLTAVVATALMLTGCGSSISGAPVAGEIDVRHLNVGRYPIEPLDSRGVYLHSYDNGKSLAAIRLANHVALGIDIDPRLKFGAGAMAIIQDYDLSPPLSGAGAVAALRNKVIFGFASGSMDIQPNEIVTRSVNATLLTLTVLQFPSNNDAEQAAIDIEANDFNSQADLNHRVPLDRYPNAHSHSQSGVPALESTIAHGQYIVSVFTQTPGGDINALKSLTEKAFDRQIAMLDHLPPLSPVEVIKQDIDPDRMLRRLLNPDEDWEPDPRSLAAYDLQGFLQFQADPLSEKRLYQSLHIEKFGVGGSYFRILGDYTHQGLSDGFQSGTVKNLQGDLLYRSPNISSAHDTWLKILNAPDPSMTPKNVPDTKCAQLPTEGDVKNFTCAVRYRQYVGLVWGRQLDDAQQRAAAQYALLANSQGM